MNTVKGYHPVLIEIAAFLILLQPAEHISAFHIMPVQEQRVQTCHQGHSGIQEAVYIFASTIS